MVECEVEVLLKNVINSGDFEVVYVVLKFYFMLIDEEYFDQNYVVDKVI